MADINRRVPEDIAEETLKVIKCDLWGKIAAIASIISIILAVIALFKK